MSTKISVFSIAFVLYTSLSAYAQPISILGVAWNKNFQQIAETLEERGYKCKTDHLDLSEPFLSFSCAEAGKEFSSIYIDEKSIDFSCRIFGLCDAPLREVAQKFINDGKVQSLTPKITKNLAGQPRLEYCGSGDEGDVVCLQGKSSNDNLSSIVLLKGAFGKNTSFD